MIRYFDIIRERCSSIYPINSAIVIAPLLSLTRFNRLFSIIRERVVSGRTNFPLKGTNLPREIRYKNEEE